jgi:FdhD protein
MAIETVPVIRMETGGGVTAAHRAIPVEVPVAIVHDGSTHAVMMATPDDLEDFAVGFSISEGVIAGPGDIASIEIVTQENGWEARLWLVPDAARVAVERRRRIVGPTGCGLCGVDSLDLAVRPAPPVPRGPMVTAATVIDAVRDLTGAQVAGRSTRATHAAALFDPAAGIQAMREDVGRHNALDKLVGHVRRNSLPTAEALCVITSRVSVEMVQKTAILGTPILVAVSAPTSLALAAADSAGLTVCAVVRDDAFEVFTGPERIAGAVR